MTVHEHLQHALDIMRQDLSDDPQQARLFVEFEALLTCAVSEWSVPLGITRCSRRNSRFPSPLPALSEVEG